MAGQSDYLPPGLPLNRAKWPQECQIKEHYDMRASALIRQLFEKKVTRQAIVEQIGSDAGKLPGVFQRTIKFLAGETNMKRFFDTDPDPDHYSEYALRRFAVVDNTVGLLPLVL